MDDVNQPQTAPEVSRTIRLPGPVQDCWTVGADGFLIHPDPVVSLSGAASPLLGPVTADLDDLADALPSMIRDGSLRRELDHFPLVDVGPLTTADPRVVERAFQIYAHLANAYVHGLPGDPADRLPAPVAVPLVALAAMVSRPPILAYASTALTNFVRRDPEGPVEFDNLDLVQRMVGDDDEAGFHLTHVQIEAEAAVALVHLRAAGAASAAGDATAALTAGLDGAADAIGQMASTFADITRRCRPQFYFQSLRPFLFGFDDVWFEGAEAGEGARMTLRGQSAAQSSAVPAIQRHLGLRHTRGALSDDLDAMVAHMPAPHRDHLRGIDTGLIRGAAATGGAGARRAYDACVTALAEFRSLHLGMAHRYIASHVTDPRGTGGTDFMPWLKGLRDETREHLLGDGPATISLPEG